VRRKIVFSREEKLLQFEVLRRCDSRSQLYDEADRLVQAMGFDYWAYSAKLNTGGDRPACWSMHNFTESMWAAYCACNSMGDDAIAQWSKSELVPRSWLLSAESLQESSGDADADRLYACVHSHGVNGGICIPIHDFGDMLGTVTLTTCNPDVNQQWLYQTTATALLFCKYLHHACLRHAQNEQASGRPRLSPREVQCLTWASKGKTTWEISRVLDISEHTVNFHMRNANTKLGVVNRRQAVARSIQLGMLTA
jgi:DNA-binding CsgD family transcriptional regulator